MENKETKTYCCFCHIELEGNGNSSAPLKEGQCCDTCYADIVIPMRLTYEELLAKKEQNKDCVEEVSYKKNSPKFDYFRKEGILTNYKNIYMTEVELWSVKKACKMTDVFVYINSEFEETFRRYHKLTGD